VDYYLLRVGLSRDIQSSVLPSLVWALKE